MSSCWLSPHYWSKLHQMPSFLFPAAGALFSVCPVWIGDLPRPYCALIMCLFSRYKKNDLSVRSPSAISLSVVLSQRSFVLRHFVLSLRASLKAVSPVLGYVYRRSWTFSVWPVSLSSHPGTNCLTTWRRRDTPLHSSLKAAEAARARRRGGKTDNYSCIGWAWRLAQLWTLFSPHWGSGSVSHETSGCPLGSKPLLN